MYKARIRKDISKDSFGVSHIEVYAGKMIEVIKDRQDEWNGLYYSGFLPKSNDRKKYYFDDSCFSSITEITET